MPTRAETAARVREWSRRKKAGEVFLHPTLTERFWDKVTRDDSADGCWPWTAHIAPDGYGRIAGGYTTLATHIAWEIQTGERVPEGLDVLHRCDNPPCIRLSHLFLGTDVDNALDRERKGRGYRRSTRLTEEQVLEIFRSTEPTCLLAQRFSISKCAIQHIRRGDRWGWLTSQEAA